MINAVINFTKIKGYFTPPSYKQPNSTRKLQVLQSSWPFTCFTAKEKPLLLNFLSHVPLLSFRFITLLLQTVILILAFLAKIEQKNAFPHSFRTKMNILLNGKGKRFILYKRTHRKSSFSPMAIHCYHFDTNQTVGNFINANVEVYDNNIY